MKRQSIKDYTNKTIFLGIDVHKKTYAVTAICDGQVVKRDTLKAEPDVLIAYCHKRFVGAKIKSAYEAGFCGFHLHRTLEKVGIKNLVVDAAGIEVAVGNRVKTDKRDSMKLASHLSEGKLKGIHVPSVEREDKRMVTRLREKFARKRSSLACQLKALLYLHGLIRADDNRKISLKWIDALKKIELSPGLKFALNQYIDMWLHINNKIKEIDKAIASQAKKDKTVEVVYRSGPGIGPTSARILANELEDLSHFNNERQLSSYTGLTPSEHSSGENIRQGNITRHGKPILRKILTQIAWRAIKIDKELGEIFERISKKAGKNKAILAIARKIICRLRACFKKGELYAQGQYLNEEWSEEELSDETWNDIVSCLKSA